MTVALPDLEPETHVESATAILAQESAPSSDRFYPRLFGVAGLSLLGWVLFKIFTPFLTPILWSALLAFLLQRPYAGLKRRLKGRAGLAAGLLTFGATLCVTVPAAVLGVAFSGQVSQLLVRVSEAARRVQVERPADLLRLTPVAAALDWVTTHFSVTATDLQNWIVEGARRLLQLMAAHGGTLVVGVLGLVLNLVLTVFLLFFFLRDGAAMVARLDRAVPVPEERKKSLVSHLSSVTKAVVLGTLVTSIVQGTLVAIGFAVLGLPSPIVFGAVAAALTLLPIGGTALVWAPAAAVLAAQGRWPSAIGLAIYGIFVVGMADNVLKPRLVSAHAEIGTLPVFFGVLGGLASFGLIGAILGPVVIALALALLNWAGEGGTRTSTA
jgi:predicted PurR-regulated permease PerM